jgi:hypothetical protein
MPTSPPSPSTEIPDGLGPYEVWNFGAGSPYVFSAAQKSSRYLTALAELKPATAASAHTRSTAADAPVKVWLPTLWRSDKTRHDLSEPKRIPFVIRRPDKSEGAPVNANILRGWLMEGLTQENLQPFLKCIDVAQSRFRVGLPIADAAMKELDTLAPEEPDWQPDAQILASIEAQTAGAQQNKRVTIFAIIDDGLPFAHRNFRDASGKRTRVEFCWLQSAEEDPKQKSVLFGREYLRTDIERYIKDHGGDEDALYRAAGATDDTEGLASMIERHTTHGAHVMDLATGYASERGEQPVEEIRIIGVQLPNVVTMDTSGVGKDMCLLSAFHYIFDRADRIAEKYGIDRPRLVINFSYGYFGGPHDGHLDLEAALGDLIQRRRNTRGPTALVLPAGNSFLDRMHATIPEARFANPDREARLRWRLQPADRTPNFCEIWFPTNFDPVGYTVEVRDPRGILRGSLPVEITEANGDRICGLFDDADQQGHQDQIGQLSVDQHTGHCRVLVVTAPSEPEDEKSPRVDAGAWTIVIRRDGNAAQLSGDIRCWIQRDTDPADLRSGARQSYFDEPDDARYENDGSLRERDTPEALVRRFGSLNGLATANGAMSVAGFRLGAGLGSSPDQARPVCYSCAGTEGAAPSDPRITCASMSDRAKALPGTIAAGTRSGARSVLQGTSVAAPFVARQLVTTFVTASDAVVHSAEAGNYLDLLLGTPTPSGGVPMQDRLGAVLVPPHRQPGL